MIRRLRRRHRFIWFVLAVLLPSLYFIALAARDPAPLLDALPEPLRAGGPPLEPAGALAPRGGVSPDDLRADDAFDAGVTP